MTASDLRTSTRHLASRIIRNPLAKGSAWNGAAQVVGSLGTFLGTVVAAWLLGLKDFGGLSVVQATVGVITGLAGLGMGMVVTRFVAKYLEVDILRAGDHLSTAVGAIIISTLLMAPIYLALCPWIAESVLHHPSLVRPLEIATPLIVIGPLAGVLGSALGGLHQFRSLATYRIVRTVFDTTGLIVGCLVGGITWAIAGGLIGDTITVFLAIPFLRAASRSTGIPLGWKIRSGVLREMMGFAGPSYITSILIWFSNWIVIVMLVHTTSGLSQNGLFTVANRVALVILLAAQTLSTVYFPVLTSSAGAEQETRYRRHLATYVSVVGAVTSVLAIIVALLAPLLLSLLNSHSQEAITTLRILAFGAIPTAANTILGVTALSRGKVAWWIISDVVLAGVLIGVGAWLIPTQRAVGMAWADMASMIISCIVILPAFWTRASRRGVAHHDDRDVGFDAISPSVSLRLPESTGGEQDVNAQ